MISHSSSKKTSKWIIPFLNNDFINSLYDSFELFSFKIAAEKPTMLIFLENIHKYHGFLKGETLCKVSIPATPKKKNLFCLKSNKIWMYFIGMPQPSTPYIGYIASKIELSHEHWNHMPFSYLYLPCVINVFMEFQLLPNEILLFFLCIFLVGRTCLPFSHTLIPRVCKFLSSHNRTMRDYW